MGRPWFLSMDGGPERIQTIVLSAQHTESVSQDKIREDLIGKVVRPMVPEKIAERYGYLGQPKRPFCLRRTLRDTGLTGRKIIVDTYGGAGRHGGGRSPAKIRQS